MKILRIVLLNIIVFAAYFISAYFGLKLGAVSGFATLVWVPSGIAIAAILIFGYRLVPGIFLAAFLVNLQTGAPFAGALGIGVGNSLEAVAGAFLIRSYVTKINVNKYRDSVAFIILGCLLATMLSPSIGVLSLFITGKVMSGALTATWIAWWLGDMLGMMVFGFFILSWAQKIDQKTSFSRLIEIGMWTVILTAISFAVFWGDLFVPELHRSSFVYLVFIPIVWAAIRFGQRAVAVSILTVYIIGIWGSSLGLGPFSEGDLSTKLLFLGIFMGSISSLSIILGAAFSELRQTQESIKNLNEELEQKIQERTRALSEAQKITHIGSWEWDVVSNRVSWSDELYAIFGLDPKQFEASYEGFLKYVHPEDKLKVDTAIKKALEDKKPFEFTYRIIRPNNEIRTLRAEGKVIQDADGKAIKMFGIGRDITDIITAQNSLLERTQELEKLNKIMIDREVRMINLKKELEENKK